jgi:hypothetical protein
MFQCNIKGRRRNNENVDWIHLADCCKYSNETSGSIRGTKIVY